MHPKPRFPNSLCSRLQRIGRLGWWKFGDQSQSFWWSQAARRLLGTASIPRTLEDFRSWANVEDRESLDWVFSGRSAKVGGRLVVRPHGDDTARVLELRYERVRFRGRTASHLYGTVSEITPYYELEEELRHARRMESLGVVAGAIIHDFNNFLTVIMGNLELARMDRQRAGMDPIAEAMQASENAKQLTQRLLSFPPQPAFTSKIPLAKILSHSQVLLPAKRVQLEWEITPDLWPTQLESAQVEAIVHNLLANAAQAMPRGGRVSVTAENVRVTASMPVVGLSSGPYVRIRVSDQGAGIDPKIRHRIFEPFFTTKPDGQGLGLALASRILHGVGGTIEMETQTGEGTTFLVYIPATPSVSRAMAADTSGGLFAPNAHILLVEDEIPVARTTAALLESLGLRVSMVHTGSDALAAFRQAQAGPEPFACVMLDLILPFGMSGDSVFAELRQLDPRVPIILCSGYPDHTLMERYAPILHYQGFLAKPFNTSELRRVLQQALAARSPG